MTKPSNTTTSLIVRLVLPLKVIISGKINPSAATVRKTVTCLFLKPEVRIVTDFLPVGTNDLLAVPCQKIQEFCPYYQSREMDTFLS